MSGGKETPRQKMIGMMYLVLTALLALNVSKQIVAAFITLNDKLESSAEVINSNALESYGEIDKKRAGITSLGGDMEEFEVWDTKAQNLKNETAKMIHFILSECNDMIVESEGEDWVAENDEDGNIIELKSLNDIQGMDNYDIPTNMFVGGDPNKPNERGMNLIHKMHAYRDYVCELMGSYSNKKNQYSFDSPTRLSGLTDALKTANPTDTSSIAKLYKRLTIPEELHAHGEDINLPWVSVTFDHAPIVAAAAMFTSLRLDIKNAESMAVQYMVDQIDAPVFDFNKIEPMTLATSAYINMGDSLPLNIKIAAYDSNEVSIVKWGMDADTIPENWNETSGGINLSGAKPGAHRVKGVIGVRERGDVSWKPWAFDYTVGQPMGVVAQPNMRVLYIGYDNVVEATASGFPAENVSMIGSGCRIVKQGNEFFAKVGNGTKNATITVKGKNGDGSSVSVGSYEYKCVPLPPAEVELSRIKTGDRVSYGLVKAAKKISVKYGEGINLDVKFEILGGFLKVDGLVGQGSILPGGSLDKKSKDFLNQSRGKSVVAVVKYKDPAGTIRQGGLSFVVKN